MTTEMMKDLANKLLLKHICFMQSHEPGKLNRYACEIKGIESALNTLGIEYEYEYNDSYYVFAVTVGGVRVA